MGLLSWLFGRKSAAPAVPQSGAGLFGRPKRNAAWDLILSGAAPEGFAVEGALVGVSTQAVELPAGLSAPYIDLKIKHQKELPADLLARRIIFREHNLERIGPGLRCDFLALRETALRELPDDCEVRIRIDLSGCRRLAKLPDRLKTGSLILTDCAALEALPRGLEVSFLDLSGCTSLKALPDDLRLHGGRLNLRDCALLTELPSGLGEVAELDLSGCLNLRHLPAGLTITSWIDLAGSGIAALPPEYDHLGVRWRGVTVPRRVVFEPESLTPDEIFAEKNAEIRRVMMERFGYERLLDNARAEELDRDQDAGGERRLLRVPIEDDEDLVCVAVQCPSTGHRFVLRVPPHIRTCRAAVAWTAGYDKPERYAPEIET